MTKEQENILQELLKVIRDGQEVGGVSYSMGNELTSLVRHLQVA